MAAIYVRSTDGSNSDNGSTWALAKSTLAGADAIDAAGDTIYVSQSHAENAGSAIALNFAGTLASPTKIICGNDGAQPPTAVATSATITGPAAANLGIAGNLYCYGITFICGTGTSSAGSLTINNTGTPTVQRYEQSAFSVANTNTASVLAIGAVAGGYTYWRSCNVKFGNASQSFLLETGLHWNGGAMVAGGTSPSTLIGTYYASGNALGGTVLVENVDLSGFSSSMNLSACPSLSWKVTFRNCKLPSSWTGGLINTAFTAPGRVEMYNCDNAATNYRLWIEDYAGTIRDETTLIRTGGASDGTTGFAWKMTSSANTTYPTQPLASPEFVIWNDATGSAKTVTVEILRDSATNLENNEVWLEANYLGASGNPQGTLITNAVADALTAAADQTTSSATWTTTGMSNPNKQKLAVTFTPQLKGYLLCRVMLAKASATVYVDPMATVA